LNTTCFYVELVCENRWLLKALHVPSDQRYCSVFGSDKSCSESKADDQ